MSIIRKAILAFALMAGFVPAFAQAPPPVPALPDTERRTTYSISASTCACAVNFALYGDSTDYANWLEVWVNGTLVPQSGNWTITSPSGSLEKLPRPITDAVLTFNSAQTGTVQIVGARRPRRTAQFAENRGVAARDLNQVLTDIIAQNRETWDKINDVTGRTVLAPPGETLNVLATATARASSGACFDAGGQLVACVSVPSATFTAGNGITITGTNPKTITNNIQASGPITITGTNPLTIGCPTCNTSPATATSAVFLASRTVAATLNLSTYSVVRTGGYAAAGDSGGATFKNVGSAPFLDSGIATGTLTAAGSGYTNGTYYGVYLTGGTGTHVQANVTVAGGVVTNVVVTGTGGNGYTPGDVLSAAASSIGGTGSGFTWTVSTVTSPLASFTDSVGTRFQYVVDQGNYPNIRQFGAKLDRAGKANDGLATNDQAAIQAALNFATYGISTSDVGGFGGNLVIVPAGTSLVCGGLVVPSAVKLKGVSEAGSVLKECDTEASTKHFITLGDPLNHQTAHFAGIEELTLFGANAAISGTVAMVYSGSANGDAITNVSIYPIYRGCVYTDSGYGGPNMFHIYKMNCVPNSSVTPFGVNLNSASNHLIDGGTWFSAGGSPWAGQAIIVNTNGSILNAFIDVHCENIVTCAYINTPAGGAGSMTYIRGMTGNATVTYVVNHATGSVANQLKVELSGANGASCVVRKQDGTCVTGNILADTVY